MYRERKGGARPYYEGLLNASLQSMDVILNQNNITFRRTTSDDGSSHHDKVSIMASPCVNYLAIKSPMTWVPWVTSILRMRKLRLEEMKQLFQGHLASKWRVGVCIHVSLTTKPRFLSFLYTTSQDVTGGAVLVHWVSRSRDGIPDLQTKQNYTGQSRMAERIR